MGLAPTGKRRLLTAHAKSRSIIPLVNIQPHLPATVVICCSAIAIIAGMFAFRVLLRKYNPDGRWVDLIAAATFSRRPHLALDADAGAAAYAAAPRANRPLLAGTLIGLAMLMKPPTLSKRARSATRLSLRALALRRGEKVRGPAAAGFSTPASACRRHSGNSPAPRSSGADWTRGSSSRSSAADRCADRHGRPSTAVIAHDRSSCSTSLLPLSR